MPKFGPVPLFVPGSPTAGAVLFLTSPSRGDRVFQFAGAELEFQDAENSVVLRNLGGSTHADVKKRAITTANNALDALAMIGGPRAALADVEVTNVVWWAEAGKSTARLTATSTMYISMTASAEVRDKSGALVPPPPAAPPVWHESMRYFRMSQVTGDLYDAFRNVYLALESILSTIEPVRVNPAGKPEGEGEWVKRAVGTAGALVDLKAYLAAGVAPSTDAASDVIDELYRTVRTSIFHAKNGRPVLLPQDEAHRTLVTDALERYTRLYVDLVNAQLGVTFPSGGMTAAGFAAMFGPRGTMTLCVSEDQTPYGKSDVSIAPNGGAVAHLTTVPRPDLSAPLYDAIFGSADVATALASVPTVSRFGALLPDGQLGEVEVLPQPLELDGFDTLECVMAARGVNAQQPRSVYET
jgi:hypothetical protein